MTLPDLINGGFEFGGAVAQLLSIRRLLADRMVRGVSLPTITFFNLWGFWNLYYYSHLEQILSWAGGMFLTATNTAWLVLAIFFAARNRTPP